MWNRFLGVETFAVRQTKSISKNINGQKRHEKMNAAAGPIPVALRAPYIDPAAKQQNSELIAPSGLSKQWGPLNPTTILE